MNTYRVGYDWGARPEPVRTRLRRRKALVLVLVAAVLFPLVFAGWLWFHVDNSIRRIDSFPDYPDRPAAGAGTNWLLVGSDSREGLDPETVSTLNVGEAEGNRTDTILIAHLPDNSTTPTLISIPRDSKVPVPGVGRTLINESFARGGPQLLAQTVEMATGLRMDHYLEIGFGGFANIVDSVGGVEMCLEKEMTDSSKLHTTLPAGCNVLDGPQALSFVRMRYSDATPRSDLDRVANQRKFIGALADKASGFGTIINPFRAYALADSGAAALTMFESDGPSDLLSLGQAMRGISSGGVVNTTVPVTDSTANRWDKEKALELFEAVNTDRPVPENLVSH